MKIIESIDITGKICDLHPQSGEWPMYSYSRPSYILWDAAANYLWRNGWTEEDIKTLLQSKHPRWSLDNSLGDALAAVGEAWAKEMLPEHKQVKKWAQESSRN